MDTRKKLSPQEWNEIVSYCVGHDNDFKGTAARYGVSYSQVYWQVRKRGRYQEALPYCAPEGRESEQSERS